MRILRLLLCCLIPCAGFAGDDVFPIGARSWGMAHAIIAQSARESIVNNVAGIAALQDPAFFAAYHSYHGFDGLSTVAFGAVLPIKKELTSGFSVQRFGDKAYNELSMGIGVAHRINRVSLGIKVNYRQIAALTPSLSISRHAVVIEMGGLVQLSSSLYMGAHIYNLTQSGKSETDLQQIPTILRVGFMYSPSSVIRLSTELVKNTDDPMSLRYGLEYEVVPHLFLRTGFSTKPRIAHAGIGFNARNFSIDYALSSHTQLGISHHFTLAYRPLKEKKS
ncbi:PorV/PorQ family protein [Arundinibacter roseus]|uniref:Type IX secretion system membrane protein PorP/SprF n=1 Tax=Arundinibacter roseus TaxID=2070510 RepID=A0A4R4K9T2_9BACT|nr:hypothetical protein [Arundinibacter roseus]TDB63402.1 hypothetical protein EZE20_16690 [Arundinibacter roseus]